MKRRVRRGENGPIDREPLPRSNVARPDRSVSSVFGIVLSIGIAACGGAGGDGGSSQSSTGTVSIGNSASAQAIRVYAKHDDGTTRTLNFGPGTEVHMTVSSDSDQATTFATVDAGKDSGVVDAGKDATATDSGTISDAAFLSGDSGGSPVQAPASIQEPESNPWNTAWALAFRASLACGGTRIGGTNSYDLPWGIGDGYNDWFYYTSTSTNLANSCENRLAVEQNLLCVADHLAQVSDAVGMVVWPSLSSSTDAGAYQYGEGDAADLYATSAGVSADVSAEWDIPPQASSTQFIVRDLALHVLALLPTVDAMTDIAFPANFFDGGVDGGTQTGLSCMQAYQIAAASGSGSSQFPCNGTVAATAWSTALFGVTVTAADGGLGAPVYLVLPPNTTALCTATGESGAVSQLAHEALTLEAQMLRAGGRLVHDLVREDVYADLAASAQTTTQSMNPTGGDEQWGFNLSPGEQPYGTIAHAARVLMGRWEIGDPTDTSDNFFPANLRDPACAGVPELNIVQGYQLIPSPYGPEVDARYNDTAIRTAGEQTAVQLVEQSGILLPSSGLASPPSLKAALAAQLLANEQAANNLPQTSNDPHAAVFTNAVNALQDAEVVFAFQRALRTLRDPLI